nr:MAG TPA: hypothetical protein [Caudoviricetes sp.]DAV12236.1 MAG TPA: hypothetical protein [Caudoviricetes sp.]
MHNFCSKMSKTRIPIKGSNNNERSNNYEI